MLPTAELIERCDALGPKAHAERVNENDRAKLQARIESEQECLAGMDARRERARGLPRKLRRAELEKIDHAEFHAERSLAWAEADLARMPPVERRARKELAGAEQILEERLRATLLATNLAPPPYITKELGERPLDPAGVKAWERGVVEIETYRQRYGIKDPDRALEHGRGRAAQRENTLWRVEQAQRALGREQHTSQKRDLGLGQDIGM